MNTRFHNIRAFLLMIMVLMVCSCVAQTPQWKKTVFHNLEQKQYEFHGQGLQYNATNRAAGLQVTLQPLLQSVSDRNQNFAYQLDLLSIVAGNYHYPLLDMPVYKASQNQLLEEHMAFTIEYLNTTQGIKQNFILPQKQNQSDEIRLLLRFSSKDCGVELKDNEIVIRKKSLEMARYNGLKVFDARGTILPAVFSLSGQIISIQVQAQHAVYPLTIDPLSTTPSTQVNGTQANMQLGYCVSGAGDVNGDGYSDVIVGASKYDNGQTNEGAAFVYLGSGSGLSTTAAWWAESNQAAAEFGINVSEAGDVNGDGYGDVIIGAYHYTNGQYQEGRAYVYHGSSSGLSATANWIYESNQDTSELGFIVSTAGDVNGDGYSDVIVGAPMYNNGDINEGIALVFHGSASGLSSSPNAMLEQNQGGSRLGWSVAAAGDVNNDGFSDVLVSACYYDNGQHDEGKAWVYAGSASGLNTTAIWTHESNKVDAYYGENVSWAGDLNGDGYGDIVVGADFATQGQIEEGLVYVYHGSTSGPAVAPTIILERNQAGAAFGVGVNGAGDVNGDGYGDLVVSAYFYSNGQTSEGAAFVYYGSSSGVSQTQFTLLEANQANANYGISVCSAGDVNGDGFSDVIVGAYFYDQVTPSAVSNGGAFFVYNGQPENIGTVGVTNMPYTHTQASANLGSFVTCIGDVNRDGFSDMAVSAPFFDNAQTNNGVVYIFHGSAIGYAAAPNTTLNGPAIANANFGSSIGAAGDVNGDGYSDIVVGAPGLSNPQAGEGAFYIYLGGASGISTSPHLSVEANLAAAGMGGSVSGAGDVNGDGYSDVIVGASGYNNGNTNEGRAYVYYGSASGVNATPDWQYETDVNNERFGICVSGVGDANGDGYSDIVVLSSGYTNGQTNEGRFHYFLGSVTGLATSAISIYETDVANANLNNQSCSFVGDLNGDGYNEVVIGISSFNSGGQANEGLLRIYYGTTPNLNFSVVQNVEGNAANFLLGATVGFGGDVNGDGYNDLITGSPTFNNGGTANEGVARVYLGTPSGLSTTPVYSFEGNTAGYAVGSSVSAAGDLNGDGYSDIIIGAKDYDAGAAPLDIGRIYAFYGNNAHGVLPISMVSRQYRSDLSTVVQTSNGTFESNCNFGISHAQKAHLGRARAQLLYEVRGHPHPFSTGGSNMNTSALYSGIQGTYTNLGLTGSVLTMGASSVPPMGFPKWRTRVKYNPIDAIDGQVFSRWFYGGIHDKQDRCVKVSLVTCGVLPIDLLGYELNCENNNIALQWQVADENNVARYDIYTSADGESFEKKLSVEPGDLSYELSFENDDQTRLVKLVALDNNHNPQEKFMAAVNCNTAIAASLHVFPNPSGSTIHVSLSGWDEKMGEITSTTVIDLNGKQVFNSSGYSSTIDLSSLVPGFYQVNVITGKGKNFSTRFVRM